MKTLVTLELTHPDDVAPPYACAALSSAIGVGVQEAVDVAEEDADLEEWTLAPTVAQLEAGPVAPLADPSAAVELGNALLKIIDMLEGTSGAGASVWAEYPAYLDAVRALGKAGLMTPGDVASREYLGDEEDLPWKCEDCGHVGEADDFCESETGNSVCPTCGSVEVAPYDCEEPGA